jgi:hypothetical protein
MATSFPVSEISGSTDYAQTHSNKQVIKSQDIGGGNFESSETYSSIKRTIAPNYKEFSLKNKSNRIEVTIYGAGRILNNVLVKEIVDKKFENLSDLNIYIENPFAQTKRVIYEENKSNESSGAKKDNCIAESVIYPSYKIINNTIYISIPKLNVGENIIYEYNVKSNRSGIYRVATLFRLENSKWSDLLKEDTIEVRPPEVNVYSERDQSYAICGKSINLTYNMLHKSGWSNDDLDINIFFNDSNQYTIYYKNNTRYNNEYIPIKLKPLEMEKYLIRVIYHEAGKHPIPNLDIAGATVYQEYDDLDVMPDDYSKILQDNWPIVSVLIAIVGFIITIIQIKNEIQKIELEITQFIESNNYFHRDSYKELKQLKDMLESGLITQQEHDFKKAEILSRL